MTSIEISFENLIFINRFPLLKDSEIDLFPINNNATSFNKIFFGTPFKSNS